jgi:hypothetical protein
MEQRHFAVLHMQREKHKQSLRKQLASNLLLACPWRDYSIQKISLPSTITAARCPIR